MLKIGYILAKNFKCLMLHLPAPGPFLALFLCNNNSNNNSVATHLILHLFVVGFSLKRVLYYIVNRHFFTRMIRYLLIETRSLENQNMKFFN